jgi:hypothetical protein
MDLKARHGVSGERITKVLRVAVASVRQKPYLLNGI